VNREQAMREWDRLDEELAAVTAERRECFFALFPVGVVALCKHGEGVVRVEVIEHHGWDERVRVRNDRTGREYCLDGARLVKPREVKP